MKERLDNMDVLFISPSNAKEIYQDLSGKYSAIEPPTWALLLAESCRSVGHEVGILDTLAENLTLSQIVDRVREANPRFLCFVVYGQNVNAGSVSMSGAITIVNAIKQAGITTPIGFIGSYVQALPYKALEDEPNIDIVFANEGVYSLRNLLKTDIDLNNLDHINGIGFRRNGKVVMTKPEIIVPQEKMDVDLPGYAWDLLPYKEKPFDLYRCPMWHAGYDEKNRSPYATLYTSLGCKFTCNFCMINILNRNDNDEVGVASNYNIMRHWSPEFIVKQFDKLNEMGVKTIRITDEMFLLNPKYYIPICEGLSKKEYSKDLLMWAYSRIDTVAKKPEILKLLKDAGIKWLCLGIESGNQHVRYEVSKGKFENVDIRDVIARIHEAGIEIIANYLFGLPEDSMETMQETLDLSLELCTSGWNAYAVMPFPGSKIYKDLLDSGVELPTEYVDYSFHSYTTKPIPTKHLSPAEVLKFRDEAFDIYHTSEAFINRIQEKFGDLAVNNIKEMVKVKLRRELVEKLEGK